MAKVIDVKCGSLYGLRHDYEVTFEFYPLWRRLFRLGPYQRTYVSKHGYFWFCVETKSQLSLFHPLDMQLSKIRQHIDEWLEIFKIERARKLKAAEQEAQDKAIAAEEKRLQDTKIRSRFEKLQY